MTPLREALGDLPGADLLSSDDAYLLVVDAAGATGDDVEVVAEDGRLRVEAYREKAVPRGFEYRREERPVFLDADLPLPPDAGQVRSVTVENGVLEVTLERE